MIRIDSYTIEENEHLYGPGRRLILFCQGCSLHCQGCVNKHLWDFEGGHEIEIEEIIALCNDLDGLTLHGGEPLDQADEIITLVRLLKSKAKTIVLFTGYTYAELEAIQKEIWEISDIVVSGRYEQEKRNIYLQFRGSSNQKVYTHKGKYKNYKISDGKSVALINIKNDGNVDVKGFQLAQLTETLNDLLE